MGRMHEGAGLANLAHVLTGFCTDNDCELHHPEVGYAEEVVGLTNLAFYLAGARAVHEGEEYADVVARVTRGRR